MDVTDEPQHRRVTWLTAARPAAERIVPGLAVVRAQVTPFARAWQAVNAEALRSGAPLWVALGDSMSQGLGAASIDGGWVGQLHAQLRQAGSPLRVVNLSVTGARLRDVLLRQAPQIAPLGGAVAVVTVLAGANDMFPRSRGRFAPPYMARLLAVLPPGRTVVATLPRRNPAALAVNAVIDDAARRGTVTVADMRGLTLRSLIGTRAPDLFHPNERGYAGLADTFGRAFPAGLSGSRTGAGHHPPQ
jgi:GDSL-like Lipase/Acylhydrolase family